ncbi:zinc ABC transporter substrate-binding protein AztC [Paracoccus onubensis]|uniref:zinc ABC transporter substrate-binding protein AztC n=1 Tax=Paracoccus onubensis TaxID=1675788 RepID=UPI00272F8B7C|nr:zinc ABC transporter substrate-binding protein AztC [Paracoccus onubensis]MDP0929974.1 zinc ABC transporter substrate-binding protein AztC [Paracoccus onubensis]
MPPHWIKNALTCAVITFASAEPVLAQTDQIHVVATISIVGDFANQVGGDRIALDTLVGPDGDAHVYEPKPADAMALARADVVLTNGLELEGFMSRLIAASGTKADIITLTDQIQTREETGGGHYHFVNGEAIFHAGAHDPHAWQSVVNARIYVRNISEAFCSADTDGCKEYKVNAERYLAELDILDAEIRSSIAALPETDRTVVVGHSAFGYYEAEYGIRFLSPQGVSTESEASAANVAGLIRQMRETNAGAIFAENISDSRLVEQIAREAGTEISGVLYSDALSPPDGPAPDYLTMMRHNTQAITSSSVDH